MNVGEVGKVICPCEKVYVRFVLIQTDSGVQNVYRIEAYHGASFIDSWGINTETDYKTGSAACNYMHKIYPVLLNREQKCGEKWKQAAQILDLVLSEK